MPAGLIALALGAFGIGLTEFVIMGLLPGVAGDFAVTEAAAGWLISGYALGVVVGALALTAVTSRLPRKPVLLGLMVLFIVGNLLTAVAGTYSIAIMFTGLTAANVLGVPFGTFLGQQFGWRSTFWAISSIGILAMIGIWALVPQLAAPGEEVSLRRELTAFRSGQVWLSLLVTILAYGGMFGAFTYIAYTLTEVSGFATTTVPWLLVLFGAGLVVGNWLGGRLADRSVDATLLFFIAALVTILAAFASLASSPVSTVVALVLMGGFGFGTVPGLQSRIMHYAGAAPTLASGANIGAFNVGNAIGAWAGGLGIAAGLGYTSPIWIGTGLAGAALIVMLFAAADARRKTAASRTAAEPGLAEATQR